MDRRNKTLDQVLTKDEVDSLLAFKKKPVGLKAIESITKPKLGAVISVLSSSLSDSEIEANTQFLSTDIREASVYPENFPIEMLALMAQELAVIAA